MSSPQVQPTRQQLDELDALMQRMLALPVDEASEASEPDRLGADSGPVLMEDPAPHPNLIPPVEPRSVANETRIARAAQMPRRLAPAPSLIHKADSVTHTPVAAPMYADATTPTPQTRNGGLAPPRVAWWEQPLAAVNQAYDAGAELAGPAGNWLRGRAVQTALGLAGFLLLALAIALGVLDWIGWTW